MKDTLRIKTYFATSVESALDLARRELGSEAMLLNSRQAPAEARHLGQYEVVFATVPAPSPDAETTAARTVPAPSQCSEASLIHAGIDPQLARIIVEAEPSSVPDYMAGLITAEPFLARSRNGREIAALIGPPGRGKTTTLAKLAITYGLAEHKPVRIFCADYLRIGAPGQLRTLAGILGVTYEEFQSPATLDHALRHALPGLTLIDTPGFGPRDHAAAQSLAQVLTFHPAVASHMVLRADASCAALASAIDRFEMFRPARLIFTGLDETTQAGAVFSAAVSSRLPVSFLANGQSIPEDLEPASTARVVELALGAFHRATVAAK